MQESRITQANKNRLFPPTGIYAAPRQSTRGRPNIPLTKEVIHDIVCSRWEPYAGRAAAARNRVGMDKVREIWTEYYGGTTLEEANKGLIKPLP